MFLPFNNMCNINGKAVRQDIRIFFLSKHLCMYLYTCVISLGLTMRLPNGLVYGSICGSSTVGFIPNSRTQLCPSAILGIILQTHIRSDPQLHCDGPIAMYNCHYLNQRDIFTGVGVCLEIFWAIESNMLKNLKLVRCKSFQLDPPSKDIFT